MSISTAILADNPAVYWKLDDPTGPAASDSSGNGNAGVYAGVFNLGLDGPEVGSHAALFQQGGFVMTLAGTPRVALPWSLDVWIAAMIAMPVSTVLGYNGRSDSRGAGLVWGASSQTTNSVATLRGGISTSTPVGATSIVAWHHYGLTYSAGGAASQYIDGVQQFAPAPFAFNAINAADKFSVGGVGQELAYFAHAALYPSELSVARMAAHFAANTTPLSPTTVQGTATLAATFITVLNDLSAVLAAVRKTY